MSGPRKGLEDLAELFAPEPRKRTLQDIMWEDLLSCIDQLMEDDDYYEDDSAWDRTRCEGRAEGVAWCLAVLIQSPGRIDINRIKEEAMDRWRANQEA